MSKTPIFISIALLAAIAGLGWHHQQQLIAVRAAHNKLVAEAVTLGIFPDPDHSDGRVRGTKHALRRDKAAQAKSAANDIIELVLNAQPKRGALLDREKSMHAVTEAKKRLLLLDAAQLEIFISELRGNPDLTDESRNGFIWLAAATLASSDHPQAALDLVTGSSDLLEENANRDLVGTALAAWSTHDPAGAVSWVREHDRKFPDLVTDNVKTGLLTSTAVRDPKLAFRLIGDLGLPVDRRTIESITKAAGTSEERHAMLAALRDFTSGMPDGHDAGEALESGLRMLAFYARSQGEDFETASRWIESAGLSPEELEAATYGTHDVAHKDAGKWIEWYGNSALPADVAKNRIFTLTVEWTQKDHRAAGQWLVDAPDGSAKQTAIRAFAETVFPYDRDAAYQWAETLPPGPDRDRTLRELDDRSQSTGGD